jgi:hypothetical protein
MAVFEPKVVAALLRYHNEPEMRHVDDTAEGWGGVGWIEDGPTPA